MKGALVILMTLVSLLMSQTPTDSPNQNNQLATLGKLVINERANIFVGKIMPPQYIKIKKAVEKPCQCRYLCSAMSNCSSATWLGMPNNSVSFCLMSQDYFSHLELTDPTTEDYASHFELADATANDLSCMTFHWFRNDYQEGGKFYKVHSAPIKLPFARNTCKNEGGRLATLEYEGKFQEVTGILTNPGVMYWIGLQRSASDQPPMWQYINGERAASGNHIKAGGSNTCFSLKHSTTEDWFIEDTNCGTNLSFVCERNF